MNYTNFTEYVRGIGVIRRWIVSFAAVETEPYPN